MQTAFAAASSISRFNVGIRNGRAVSLQLREFLFEDAPPSAQGDGTGLKVWPTARPMLKCVQRLIGERFGHVTTNRPLNILELGSGCGYLGLGLAATCRANVVVTDPGIVVSMAGSHGTTLDWLRENIELNSDVLEQGEGSVRCEQLRWGDDAAGASILNGGGFDLVVGSDLLYDPVQYPALLSALHALAGPGDEDGAAPVAVLGYPERHGDERSFWQLCDEAGELVTGETVQIDASVGPRRPRLVLLATYLHRHN